MNFFGVTKSKGYDKCDQYFYYSVIKIATDVVKTDIFTIYVKINFNIVKLCNCITSKPLVLPAM